MKTATEDLETLGHLALDEGGIFGVYLRVFGLVGWNFWVYFVGCNL